MVDLCSAQSRRASICRRVACPAETTPSRTSIHRIQPTRCNRSESGQTLMLPGTSTQLCWRKSACHRVVTSISAAPLHSWKICAMVCETGGRSPGMCIRKSSVLLMRSPRVWRRLGTLLTCHKGRRDLAPQSRSRVAELPPLGIRNLGACLNWRKRVTFRSDGHAELESAIPA